MEHEIRGRLVFAKGRCSSILLFKSSCVKVPQAEASSVLARIEDLQAEFDHETFPQSSGVSASWEQEFVIGEGMFEILELQSYPCFIDIICTCIQYHAGFELQQLPDRLTRKLVFILVTNDLDGFGLISPNSMSIYIYIYIYLLYI